MLKNIRIVLVNTSHPGNIGAAARAIKTMGLSRLYLVDPLIFPDVRADEMASGALDILGNAQIFSTLDEAIFDCGLVVGTSARSRAIPWPHLLPREFAEKAMKEPENTEIAVVFGREQSGLTNEELHRCHFHVEIPSNPSYSSLNIAAAVQVIAYECRLASMKEMPSPSNDYPYATANEMQGFYQELEKTLISTHFLNPKTPRQLMTRLRRLFHRARPDMMEVNILRGILNAIQKKII